MRYYWMVVGIVLCAAVMLFHNQKSSDDLLTTLPKDLKEPARAVSAVAAQEGVCVNRQGPLLKSNIPAKVADCINQFSVSRGAVTLGSSLGISNVMEQVSSKLSSQSAVTEDEVAALISYSRSPADFGAVSQLVDRFHSDVLWSGVDRYSIRDADVIARFSGLLLGCSITRCGPRSAAAEEVCNWPKNQCSEFDDFEAALARNFSPNQVEVMHMLEANLRRRYIR